jgi:glycosyltransferase involved in cell wall biosynthesis
LASGGFNKVIFLSVVVPCYNEEEVLRETAGQLSFLLDRMAADGLVSESSGIVFVDDGSRDGTWSIIADLHSFRPGRFHGLKLSRNQGHQRALLAGLQTAPGDAVVSIDADLQDDMGVIPDMIRKMHEGCDVVFGVRDSRATDTRFKRWSARSYYWLLGLLGVEIIPDHADFRLMSRRALDALGRYGEVNLFLRAIVPLLGFTSGHVKYNRAPRFAGESKYPLSKMIGLAINGVTSFSMRPLRVITIIGMAIAIMSFGLGFWAIAVALFTNRAVPGWASVIVPIAFVGGLQLLSMGVIGEYVGKIYLEVKRRPMFEIEKQI